MDERRKEQRTEVDSGIEVSDGETGEKIGNLIDISPKGLRIKGEEPIEIYDHIKLVARLNEKIFGRTTITAYGQCIWSQSDTESDQWISGFEFYEVSHEDSNTIIGFILESKNTD